MTAIAQPPAPRGISDRRRAALDHLNGDRQLWLVTGSDGRGAHLIPVAYIWDGSRITMATFENSRTVANLRANPRARVALGEPSDLVMIDGRGAIIDPAGLDAATADAYARVSFDPRALPGLVYLVLTPERMQVWNGFHEFHGRTVMASGDWLEEPADPPSTLPAWMTP